MNKLISLAAVICSMIAVGQTDSNPSSEKRVFATQGEQENYWAEKFFKEKYKEEIYLPFEGKITTVDSLTIRFDNKILYFWSTDSSLTKIFKNGIFFPQLLLGYDTAKKRSKNKSALDKFLNESDTLKISNFEELKFLPNSSKVKRFRFWRYLPNIMNAQVYLLELKNDSATEKTSLEDFIKGARLTFLRDGWIVI